MITNASHDDYNSNCDAATAKALEMGALHFEAGGMKRNAPTAVEARCTYLVFLFAHFINFTFWMA